MPYRNPEDGKAQKRRYYLANREKFLRRAGNRQLGVRYGLTPEAYQVLYEAQNGVCAICGKPPDGKSKNWQVLQVDHDHVTGRVRGLLCGPCNAALGGFKDNVRLLQAATSYLSRG